MSAKIIRFPGSIVRILPMPTALPASFAAPQWREQHLPLIDAALELPHVDDAEFEKRCRQMHDAEGRTLLEELSSQLDRLGSHVGDVVEALAMTAMRIRTTMAQMKGQPA